MTTQLSLTQVTPSQLARALAHNIKFGFPTMIKGAPGVGKSDIVLQACVTAGADIILTHPVVSDPTDYKGLPFVSANGDADFKPYGLLRKLLTATKLTVCLIDDLGQAPPSVQASIMQIILAREINGHKISEFVVFIAATNRKQDKAAVSGILEPVKSRFYTILELVVNTEDWVKWALLDGQPTELIAFNRYKPDLLLSFEATKDIVNTPSPRTVANAGKIIASNPPKDLLLPMIAGATGDGYATEYKAFADMWKDLPNIDAILMGKAEPIPTEPGVMYATIGALAARVQDVTASNCFTYLKKMPEELQYACVRDMTHRSKGITMTRGYIDWQANHANFMLGD